MFWVTVLLIAVVVLLAILLIRVLRGRDGHSPGAGGDDGDAGGPPDDEPPCEPPVVDPEDVIPSVLDEKALPGVLGVRLRGQPSTIGADAGSDAAVVLLDPADGTDARVVWVDGSDEALVHLDSVTTRIVGGTLVVSLDLETDQTGRAPVIVRFALGGPEDPAGLLATTDEVAAGHPVLVDRWGATVRAAVWSSLLALGADHGGQRGGVAGRLAIDSGTVVLQARTPIALRRAPGGARP